MQPYVVDASVAVKWFLPEIHAEAAARLLAPDAILLVPDLLYPEIGNIVWKRVRAGEITREEASTLVQALGALPLQVHPAWPLVLSALEIACNTGAPCTTACMWRWPCARTLCWSRRTNGCTTLSKAGHWRLTCAG